MRARSHSTKKSVKYWRDESDLCGVFWDMATVDLYEETMALGEKSLR